MSCKWADQPRNERGRSASVDTRWRGHVLNERRLRVAASVADVDDEGNPAIVDDNLHARGHGEECS